MADNRVYENGRKLSVICSHPASPSSGQPVRIGQITGVALVDERAGGDTSVDFGPAVYDLSVEGIDDNGNAAVSAGDQLFYVDADIDDGSGFLSKKASGYFFGFALEAVDSGSTTTIKVMVLPSPGPGTADIPAGVIGADELAIPKVKVISQAVTIGDFTDNEDTTGYVDLDTQLPKGAIPLGCKFIVATGFTNDTSATVQAGVSGDLDRFTGTTDQSVFSAGTVGSTPAADGCDGMNAAQTIRVTVTGGADFTSINAGEMTVNVYYIETE